MRVILIIILQLELYLIYSVVTDGVHSKPNEQYQSAGVVANGEECADIGIKILQNGGSAADSVIATLLCEGITCPQSMGIGGGFLLTIYSKETGVVETMNAREVAPIASDENMFVNVTQITGPLSIAVPGEIKGYWELHKKYGKLPWSSLFDPTIELCQNGHIVTGYLARILKERENIIRNSETLRDIYFNPETDKLWVEGDVIKRLDLVETLQIIARDGSDALYNRNGKLIKKLVKDIQNNGGIITVEDLENYKVEWNEPEILHLVDNQTLYASPLPGTGSIVAFIMNILNGYINDQSLTAYQRIIESFKYAYALRTELADPLFVPDAIEITKKLIDPVYGSYIQSILYDNQTNQDPKYYGAKYDLKDDYGTAHIGILAPNGDAVSVTSTINTGFGSKFRSRSTGIILNDEMEDFGVPGKNNVYGVPPSPRNFIVPGKRPLSSMSSTIITDRNGDVRLIIGAAGGTKILTAVPYVIIRHLWFNESLSTAISARRLHHQLVPMHIEYEDKFDDNIINGLIEIGHKVKKARIGIGFTSVTGIACQGQNVYAVFDPRRGGSSRVF